MDTLEPGAKIDRYTIEGALGEGGMGRVYRAHDERLDRKVALKVLLTEREEGSDGRARLLREARAAATLDHPNVVGVYDVGEANGAPFIVMELVDGKTLRDVATDRALPMADRLRYLRDVASALSAAHEAGLVHRDVKPENVIVRSDGRVKVLDFGIARRKRPKVDPTQATDLSLSTLTADGIKVGTPMYMAPEQIRGQSVDGRTDQFAWGVTAYEVLTGRSPWTGKDSLEVMAAVLTETPPDLPTTIPAKARALVLKALQKKSDDRCASMQSIVRTLDALLDPAAERAAESLREAAPVAAEKPAPRVESTRTPSSRPTSSSPASASSSSSSGSSSPSSSSWSWGPPPGLDAPYMPPMRMTLSQRYSPRELEEILDRALRMQPGDGYRHDDVVAAAREVGIDDPTLRVAMRDLVKRGAVEVPPEDVHRARMRLFRHVGIWLVVSLGFFLMNVFDRGTGWWFQSITIIWGIAVGIHAVTTRFKSPRRQRRLLHYRIRDPRADADAQVVANALGRATSKARVDTREKLRVAPVTTNAAEAARLAEIQEEVDAELSASPRPRARVERG